MTNKPYVVLVGTDFSELADRALQEGFALASKQQDAEVHVVSLILPPAMDASDAIPAYAMLGEGASLEATQERLRTHVQAEAAKFSEARKLVELPFRLASHVSVGAPAHGIAQLASDLAADLIVVGTHSRRGLERFLLGSVAQATVRYAHCPVLVIPAAVHSVGSEVNEEQKLQPPCTECVKAREASQGSELWCAQHRERHGRRHTYHQSDRSSSDRNFPLTFR